MVVRRGLGLIRSATESNSETARQSWPDSTPGRKKYDKVPF
jgi:hypothetical protein